MIRQSLECFFMGGFNVTGYMTIKEAKENGGSGERRINTLWLQGRIEGAVKFGTTWAIANNAVKPKDE